jgi:ABC-type glycerol-3-phosphate transport system substrate-binding protein
MTTRLCVILLCALALAGCGSSGTSTTKSGTTKHTHTSTVPLKVRLDKAITECKKEVATNAYIPAAEKRAGKADCEGVKSGNFGQVAALRTMLRSACELEVTEKDPAAEKSAGMVACKKVY